jgi:ADP-ribose pyrophosphatase YjhB (NUDIX family)
MGSGQEGTKMDLAFEIDNKHFTCRVAAIILEKNQILMAKHKDYPCYYTVGGRVKINESTEDAIIREIKEETGIDYEIENLSFVQERFYTSSNQEQHEITFYYKTKENIKTKNLENKYSDQGENEKLYLLDIDNLNSFNVVPTFFKDIQLNNLSGLKHILTRE